MFVRSSMNYSLERVSEETAFHTGTDTPTVQSAKDEADINQIVRKFGITGQIPSNLAPLLFGDFSEVGDFSSAMAAVRSASERFMELPSDVRTRFANDPQRFLEFCEARNEAGERVNIEDMRKMGLAVAPPADVVLPPVKVEVINPAPPGGPPK